jgi:PAS domain S-box-containing protein
MPQTAVDGHRRPLARASAVVLGSTAAALALRFVLQPVLGDTAPFTLFFPAIALSALQAGLRAGLAATVLAGIAGGYFFVPPRYEFVTSSPSHFGAVFLFVAVGSMVAALADAAVEARRRAERARDEAARQSAKFEAVFMHAQSGLCLTDERMTFLRVNPAFARIFGYDPAELEGQPAWIVLPPDQREAARAANAARLEGDTTARDWTGVTKDGRLRFVRVTGGAATDPDGRRFTIGHVLDVTDERRAVDALRESERRFRTMADSVPVIIWVTDAEGRIELVNRAYCEFFGVSEEQVKAAGWRELLHPDDAAGYAREFSACIAERRRFRAEARARRADGQWRWIASDGVPLLSPSGDLLGFVGSSPDVTDIKAAEDVLRDADRRKDAFISMVAHELRNPLAAITNAVQLLRRLGLIESNVNWARDLIERQVAQLTRIVDDLLDISRIGKGLITVRKEPVAVVAPVSLALEMARALIDARQQVLSVDLPGEAIGVDCDSARLAQALANLLQNASKFTAEGGRIDLTVAREGDRVAIRVRDTGRGMAPGLLPHVFEPFVQGERSMDRRESGLGLGLAIARKIVDLHGGTIEASSEGPGKGSVFVVRLPALAGFGAEARATPVLVYDGERLRILLVDDNADSVESLQLLLVSMGHDVRSAPDGPTALELAGRFRPQLVVLDIGLPGMDGFEVARRLRAAPGTQDALIVAVTGHAGEEHRERAREAGINHVLVKPVLPEEFLSLARPPAGPAAAGGVPGDHPGH